jgi:hypothetical protein
LAVQGSAGQRNECFLAFSGWDLVYLVSSSRRIIPDGACGGAFQALWFVVTMRTEKDLETAHKDFTRVSANAL